MSYIDVSALGFDDRGLDAFGNLPVAEPRTLFDAQQEYGLDTLRVWDATANGSLAIGHTNGTVTSGGNTVGPRSVNTGLTPITVSATDTHYAVLQSRQYVRYIPGKGHRTYITGVFAAGASATAAIVWRSSTSGSVVNTSIAQASWGVDKFNGTGPSGVTIDFTKIQILVIDAQMLYAGRIRVGFDVDGIVCWAHYIDIANNQSVPTMQAYNLPVRVEGRTGASSTAFRFGYFDSANGVYLETTRTSTGGTAYFECCSVQSFGGAEARGFPNSAPVGINTIAVTTRRPVLSIRPKATYNGKTNRAHIEEIEATLRATTNDSLVEFVVGGTLTGASWLTAGPRVTAGAFVTGQSYFILTVGTTNYTLIGAASNTVGLQFTATGAGAGTGTAAVAVSTVDYDVAATAIAGGVTVKCFFVTAGTGTQAEVSANEADIRSPLVLSQIDALTATQTAFSLVCTAFTGTSNVTSLLNWHEQVI